MYLFAFHLSELAAKEELGIAAVVMALSHAVDNSKISCGTFDIECCTKEEHQFKIMFSHNRRGLIKFISRIPF